MAEFDESIISDKDKGYFAAKPAEDCVSNLEGKINNYYKTLENLGWWDKLRDAYAIWSTGSKESMGEAHQINFSGDDGEFANLVANHYYNIGKNMHTMVTSVRPAMETRAVNTDAKSQIQTKLGNGLLDYYMRGSGKKVEKRLKMACEYAIALGAGHIKLAWNQNLGEMTNGDKIMEVQKRRALGEALEILKPEYEGDIDFTLLSPFDIVEDITREDIKQDWKIVRSYKNKYDLIKVYPQFADDLMKIETKQDTPNMSCMYLSLSDKITDDIPIWEFYHERTESVPEGRYILFCDKNTIMYDGPLPYRTIPVYSIKPSQVLGTPLGRSDMFELMPIQEAINGLYSTILTNQMAFGVQTVLLPSTANIDASQISNGLSILKYNPQGGKPEALQLTATPPEVFNFLNFLIQTQETISGINSVVRGNPEASLRSGSAIAMIQSNAIQYMSNLQAEYVSLIEDVGLGMIQMLIDFADSPRIANIVGESGRSYIKEFKGADLRSINRVVVDSANPMSKCLAKGTKVLMFDGTLKNIEDVKIGETMMGPDSVARTVGNIGSGFEMMYKISSKDKSRNVEYSTNESHILTLKYCSDEPRRNAKKGDILDITVRDYLKLPKYIKDQLQGFKVGVEFPEKNLTIPPYILGAWLGDGHSRTTAITTMDSEILNEWMNYADSIGLAVRADKQQENSRAMTYHITSGINGGIAQDRNSFMNELRTLNLIQNKHIPQIFLTSSRKQRLELLAGLLDTDGSLSGQTFVFTQKSDIIADNVKFLAESLGFRVTNKKRKVSSNFLKEGQECFTNCITIGGNTHEIPTRLPRKQVIKTEKSRDWLNYGIEVVPVGEGQYFGITLVEEPHFVLGDFSVTHNTIAGRINMADNLLQYGEITSKQYMNVINTGNLETATDATTTAEMAIKKENEMMMEGESVPVLYFEDHMQHIQGHKQIVSDPELKRNPELVQLIGEHIQEHVRLLRETDPDLLMTLGQQPLRPQGAPPPPPGGEMPPAGPEAMPQNPAVQPPVEQAMQNTGAQPQDMGATLPPQFESAPLTGAQNLERIQGQR